MGTDKAYLLEEVEALLHLVHAAVLEQPLVVAVKAGQKHDSLKNPREQRGDNGREVKKKEAI